MGNGMSVAADPISRRLPEQDPSIPQGIVIPLTGDIQHAMETSIMGEEHRMNTQEPLGKEMKDYVWEVKGDEVAPRCVSSPTPESFRAQHCPQDNVVEINTRTEVVLTVAFTGCAFFLATLGGQDIVGHFDRPGDPKSYTPLSQFIMEQKSTAIDALIHQLSEYTSAENKENFVQEKKKALQAALNVILQSNIVGDVSPEAQEYYVFPYPFSMRSGCPSEEKEDGTVSFGVTNAAFVRVEHGSWSLLTQTYTKRMNPGTGISFFDSLKAGESKRCRPLNLFPLYEQSVQEVGLE